eukprot:NODE_476_length_1709_cov_67.103614_g396_i0.p1 GENE.NODE_476_length_1709_cov_67.103614_g396_i0~~NODE_476_length_1709_cov_67.103614_g396_i0.p1  ORF type:complete len:313 (+),score=102.01 NODE_476_length_1709_cov_67.103614_g396_i0:510-1448(+)
MLICVSSEQRDLRDTDSSLLFGQATTKIKLAVKENIHKSVEELTALLQEAKGALMELREKILRTEKRLQREGHPTQYQQVVEYVLENPEPATTPGAETIVEHCCPLTKRVMTNPVVSSNGLTYERRALLKYYHKYHSLPPDELGNIEHLYNADDDLLSPSSSIFSQQAPILMIPNYNLLEQIKEREKGKDPLRPLTMATRVKPVIRRFPVWVRVQSASDIPFDCLINIFAHLDPTDLYHCTKVCLVWSTVARDDCLWLPHVVNRFGAASAQGHNLQVTTLQHVFYKLMLAHNKPVSKPIHPARGQGIALVRT